MASGSRSGRMIESTVLGRRQLRRYNSTSHLPRRISAESAGEHFTTKGGLSIISLKDGDSPLPDGIEEILLDFSDIHSGLIKSAIIPLTLKLKREEHSTKLKMTTMDSIVAAMKRMGGKEGKPFITFQKIQLMYLPLFSKVDGENGEITISLNDGGKETAGVDPVIQEVTFDASEMALVELSMDFFVRKEDMKSISINITAGGVPIEGRSYGALNVAFFTYESNNPMKNELKPSTVLYIDPNNRPKDLNTDNVIRKVGEQVKKDVEKKRRKYKDLSRANDRTLERRRRSTQVRIDRSMEDDEETHYSSEDIHISSPMIPEELEMASQTVPLANRRKIDMRGGNGLLTALDTGSPDHYFHHKDVLGEKVMNNIGGVSSMNVESVSLVISVFGNLIHLSKALIFDNDKLGCNLMSYSQLVKDKIVDSMESAGSSLFLKKDGEVVMMFDTTESGRMWLKDDDWNEKTKGGSIKLYGDSK